MSALVPFFRPDIREAEIDEVTSGTPFRMADHRCGVCAIRA